MRRAIRALAACVAVLGLAAQAAAAEIVDEQVFRCEYDAQWQINYQPFSGSTATLTYDTGAATGTGCKHLEAEVFDDGDFRVHQDDYGQAGTVTFQLDGVWGDDALLGFAGTASRSDAPSRGPLVIVGDLLNAELTYTDPAGMQAVNAHRGTGRCGATCFKTHSVVSVSEY